MTKFRKKPVVIEAVQWVGDPNEMPVPPAPSEVLRQRSLLDMPWWEIRTIEGWLKLTPGDWIITGVKGERYPCKPDIFAMTYEPATPAPAVTGKAPSAPPGTEQPGVAARPEERAQLGLFIIVLFKKKEDRRVVLSVYAPDLEAAKHMAIGRYMGEWIVERAIAKADPTVFRVHDDAWYENESEPTMNSGRDS